MDKKEFQIAIGKRTRQLREKKNISQVELAALCNFEKSNMSKLEAGNTNPTAYTLHTIAQKLEIETFEMCGIKHFSCLGCLSFLPSPQVLESILFLHFILQQHKKSTYISVSA